MAIEAIDNRQFHKSSLRTLKIVVGSNLGNSILDSSELGGRLLATILEAISFKCDYSKSGLSVPEFSREHFPGQFQALDRLLLQPKRRSEGRDLGLRDGISHSQIKVGAGHVALRPLRSNLAALQQMVPLKIRYPKVRCREVVITSFERILGFCNLRPESGQVLFVFISATNTR